MNGEDDLNKLFEYTKWKRVNDEDDKLFEEDDKLFESVRAELESLKTKEPFSDFYNPDGTLKSYEERKPIFICEINDEDSEEVKQSKINISKFLNKAYTQADDDRISRKITEALIFGSCFENNGE